MPHDLHTWLEIGQLAATLILVPVAKLLWSMRNDISEFKLYAAREYVTKDDLRAFVAEGNIPPRAAHRR